MFHKYSYNIYLDDFLILGRPNSDECGNGLSKCIAVCEQLGVPLASEKTERS